MTHTQKESSSESIGIQNKNNSGEQLVEMHKIEDTPFTIVKYDDKWFLTMGKYRLSEPQENRAAVEDMAQDTTWNRLLQVMKIMIDETIANQNTK